MMLRYLLSMILINYDAYYLRKRLKQVLNYFIKPSLLIAT